MNGERLVDGVAVVTGAAGGMGRATAWALFEAGYRHLLLCDLHEEALSAVAQALRSAGATIALCAGDMADPAYPAEIVAELSGRRIGALVHAAGLGPHQGDPARVIEVNLGGSARLVEAIRDHMAPGSAAVLIASNSARFPHGREAAEIFTQPIGPEGTAALMPFAQTQEDAYPLSKLGVIALARREAKSFGERGVRLLTLSPGATDTDMFRFEEKASGRGVVQSMLERSALSRLGRPEEIAAAAVFLCSKGASFITGTDILADGGQIAGMGV